MDIIPRSKFNFGSSAPIFASFFDLESYKKLLDKYPITKIEELQKRQDNKEELKENERAALNDYNTLSKALLILSKKPPKFIEDLKMFETIQEKTKGQFKKEIENYYNFINQPES